MDCSSSHDLRCLLSRATCALTRLLESAWALFIHCRNGLYVKPLIMPPLHNLTAVAVLVSLSDSRGCFSCGDCELHERKRFLSIGCKIKVWLRLLMFDRARFCASSRLVNAMTL